MSVNITKTEEQVWAFLIKKGLSKACAAGIMGNIKNESGFDFTREVHTTTEWAGGLIMWSDNSGSKNFTNLKTRANKKGKSWKDLDFQLETLWIQLEVGTWVSTYKNNDASYAAARPQYAQHTSTSNIKTYKQFKGLSNPEAATDVFCFRFERPSKVYSHVDKRRSDAATYFNKYSGSTYNYDASQNPTADSASTTDNALSTISNLPAYINLQNIDPYSSSVTANRSSAEKSGFDYGYLIDLTHSGQFKFYIPEFTEAAGANWGDIDIPGRSVSIKTYNNTSSRSITISLDLFAGEGLYKSGDVVEKLHTDVHFVESLEYPEYGTTGILKPPPTVQLILGPYINIVGVVSGVSIEHRKPLDSVNRSMYIRLSFTVTQNVSNPPDYNDIRTLPKFTT